MGNLLILHAIGLNEYSLTKELPTPEDLSVTRDAFLQTIDRSRKLPDVTDTILLTDLPEERFSSQWKGEWGRIVSRPNWTVPDLLQYIRQASEGYGHIFSMWSDTPLLDLELGKKMYTNHQRFFADYTFADGYPLGLSPEILKPTALTQLIELSQRHEVRVTRNYIFEVLQKDINAFDLETEVAPLDQRMLRVSLSADTRRTFLQLDRVIRAGGRDAPTVQKILAEQPELLRTLPAFVNIQVTGGCPQSCSYCPYPLIGGDILQRRDEMPLDRWTTLLDKVVEFCNDAVIGVSMWGEPSLHTRIVEVVSAVLRRPGLSMVIETSGVGWSVPVLEQIARDRGAGIPGDLTWIVSLDTDDRELYSQLRGGQWDEAVDTVDMLRALFPGQVYVQAVRMKNNEEQLDGFFRHWEKEEDLEVIVQKYDSFCGFLPERKVTDLSPIERFPCWHLKRDLAVLLDGSVPMCREDLKGEYVLGNVFQESLEEIWKRGESYYRLHLEGEYPGLCGRCDEFYTYNF